MNDDPLAELDWTVELGWDVFWREEADTWTFCCLSCGIYQDFAFEWVARWFMSTHTNRHR